LERTGLNALNEAVYLLLVPINELQGARKK